MKYLKMLGLTAVAAAGLMAFVGAGTASAETTICKETEKLTNCYGVGTKIKFHSIGVTDTPNPAGNNHVVLTGSGGFSTIECNASFEGTIETATTPSGKGSTKWSNCTNGASFETITNGTITIHHHGEHNGSVTTKGFVIKFVNGITCYFGGEGEGTLTHSTATTGAVIHVTKAMTKIDLNAAPEDSSAFCPSTFVFHATYEVDEPNPLFVNTGV